MSGPADHALQSRGCLYTTGARDLGHQSAHRKGISLVCGTNAHILTQPDHVRMWASYGSSRYQVSELAVINRKCPTFLRELLRELFRYLAPFQARWGPFGTFKCWWTRTEIGSFIHFFFFFSSSLLRYMAQSFTPEGFLL